MLNSIASSMVKVFIEHILATIVMLFLWLGLFPVIWILAMPMILLFAMFASRPYNDAVAKMFRSVNEFWMGWRPSWLGKRF